MAYFKQAGGSFDYSKVQIWDEINQQLGTMIFILSGDNVLSPSDKKMIHAMYHTLKINVHSLPEEVSREKESILQDLATLCAIPEIAQILKESSA